MSALVGVGSVAAELPLYEARKEHRCTSALAGLHLNTAPLPEGLPCTLVLQEADLMVLRSDIRDTRPRWETEGKHNKTADYYIMFKGLVLCNLLYWVVTGVHYQYSVSPSCQ